MLLFQFLLFFFRFFVLYFCSVRLFVIHFSFSLGFDAFSCVHESSKMNRCVCDAPTQQSYGETITNKGKSARILNYEFDIASSFRLLSMDEAAAVAVVVAAATYALHSIALHLHNIDIIAKCTHYRDCSGFCGSLTLSDSQLRCY